MHLDGDPFHADPDNLVYLCTRCLADHGAESLLSRGGELRHLRSRLRLAMERSHADFMRGVGPSSKDEDDVSGHYVRVDKDRSAELLVRVLPDCRLRLVGEALWGRDAGLGPNGATIDGAALMRGRSAVLVIRTCGSEPIYLAHLEFSTGRLAVWESNAASHFRSNACFSGPYVKAL